MAVPYVWNIMPRSRFECIRGNIYFCNNEDNQDVLKGSDQQFIDEHMIKFKRQNAIVTSYLSESDLYLG